MLTKKDELFNNVLKHFTAHTTAISCTVLKSRNWRLTQQNI